MQQCAHTLEGSALNSSPYAFITATSPTNSIGLSGWMALLYLNCFALRIADEIRGD